MGSTFSFSASDASGAARFFEQFSRGYVAELEDTLKEGMHAAGKASRSWLRSNAPKMSGEYRKDARFRVSDRDGHHSAVVYFDKMWPLTHLLEDGHKIANQYGSIGGFVHPAKPRHHMASAFDVGKAELEKHLGVKL